MWTQPQTELHPGPWDPETLLSALTLPWVRSLSEDTSPLPTCRAGCPSLKQWGNADCQAWS